MLLLQISVAEKRCFLFPPDGFFFIWKNLNYYNILASLNFHTAPPNWEKNGLTGKNMWSQTFFFCPLQKCALSLLHAVLPESDGYIHLFPGLIQGHATQPLESALLETKGSFSSLSTDSHISFNWIRNWMGTKLTFIRPLQRK